MAQRGCDGVTVINSVGGASRPAVSTAFFCFVTTPAWAEGRTRWASIWTRRRLLLLVALRLSFVFVAAFCPIVKYKRFACGNRFLSSPLRRVISKCGGITVRRVTSKCGGITVGGIGGRGRRTVALFWKQATIRSVNGCRCVVRCVFALAYVLRRHMLQGSPPEGS
ncbi:unnamed protein product [Laminaria digitata]